MPCNLWVKDGVGKIIKLLSLVYTLTICDEFLKYKSKVHLAFPLLNFL